MSVLPHLAHSQNRRDEIPDQKIQLAVNARQRAEFIKRLEEQLADLTGAQATRVKNVIRTVEKR